MTQMTMMETERHIKCYNKGALDAPFILPQNSLFKLTIYYVANAWCFYDEKRELITEPFVLGSSEIIEMVIKNSGFKLDHKAKYDITFSANPFPQMDGSVTRLRKELDGYWYQLDGTGMEGWLCPATTLFFGS